MSRHDELPSHPLQRSLVGIAYGLGAAAGLVGAGFLAGWFFLGPAILRDWTGAIYMKTNAALGLLLAGAGLVLLIRADTGRARRWAGRTCATLVLLIGALTFSEHLVGWNLGIDQLAASEPPGAAGVTSPDRMGPPAALSLALLGPALLLLSRRQRRATASALHQFLALAVMLIALLPTVGYLYGANELYGVARYTGIAWPTALTLLALGLGILCARPQDGLMALVTADDAGGMIVRRLLLPMALLPLVLGWLRLAGERHGFYEAALGTAMMMLIFIIVFSAITYYAGCRIGRAAADKKHAESALRESQEQRKVAQAVQVERQRFNDVLGMMPAYVVLLAPDYRVPFANRFFEQRFGKSNGKRCYEYLFGRTEPCENCETFKVLKTGQPHHWEWTGPDERHYDIHDFPFTDPDGSPLIMEVGIDITDRKRAEAAIQEANEGLERRVAERTAELRRSEQRFRVAQELSLDAFTVLEAVRDPSGAVVDFRWLYANPTAGHILRHPPSELIGRRLLDLLSGNKSSSDLFDRYVRVVETGQSHDIELRYQSDGIDGWLRNMCVKLGDGVAVGFSDITERKRVEASLLDAKAAAEAANEAKSRFLANMSHELRTPMNAILGMIDVALPKATDPVVLDCLETARGSADLLLTLLNDLLDSAKIESGKLRLEAAPFNPGRMLDQITRVLATRASEKGLCFSCRMPADMPAAVMGDRVRLQQVLLNLAGNAIKFTPSGEVEIRVRAAAQDGDVLLEFAVRDTGIGIPPDRLEQVFHPFAQGDATMARRFGGTGLGLSISRSLVEMMGGHLGVESALGKGSTFGFAVRLPLATELPADIDAAVALAAAARPLRILLAEDNPANQKLATYVLQERGHVVEIARDGQEAIDLSAQNEYDLILMDVQMPGTSGLEATAAIRQREGAGHRVPIVAMTAHAMQGDRQRCLAAGMDGYLSKPIQARELVATVESLAAGMPPGGEPAEPAPAAAEAPPEAGVAAVFDPDEALKRCFRSPEMLGEMIALFSDEVDALFPQMRAALQKNDLAEVGRLGHRLRGTILHLGAQHAEQAARAVERVAASGAARAEAEQAVEALERQCAALKSALAQDDSRRRNGCAATACAAALGAASAPQPTAVAPSCGAAVLATRRVLIVDDVADVAQGLAAVLRLPGHDVRVVSNGPAALETAASFRPQVVLVDIGLPRMNGYEVARRLRENAGAQKMLLVALTGYGEEEDCRKAREAGFDHHVLKPPDPEALLDLLARG